MKGVLRVVACVSLFLSFLPAAYAEDSSYHCGNVFSGPPGSSPPPEWQYNMLYRWKVDIKGQKYDIPFDGYITNVTANIDRHSIAFDGRSESTTLQLRLSRALIDSTQVNHDVPFTVLVNGQPISNVTESVVPSTGDRMVCIPLQNFGPMARVEIIGTTIAPEFGSLAMLIAAVTVAGMVAFRTASKFIR